MNKLLLSRLLTMSSALLFGACASVPSGMKPLPTVERVELPRFMGDWYVIAHIPPGIENESYNAVEHYELDAEGHIPTTFTYRNGSFEAPLKTLKSKAFVVADSGNAEWGVQFIWPIKAEYLITALDAEYTRVIVARNKRDYVWLMARTPSISDAEYTAWTAKIAAMGYDLGKLRKVPQRWPDPGR